MGEAWTGPEADTASESTVRISTVVREDSEQTDCLPDMFDSQEWELIARHLDLTDQQRRIVRWICRGLSNKVIAQRLGVSDNTVRTHVRLLYRKLKISNRVGVPVRATVAARTLAKKREL
jgi:DNA-binding NarL/FixJ family response regulator